MTHQFKTVSAMVRSAASADSITAVCSIAAHPAKVHLPHRPFRSHLIAARPCVIGKLNASLCVVLKGKRTKDKLAEPSIKPAGGTPEEAMSSAAQEAAKWKKVIEDAGIEADRLQDRNSNQRR